MLKSLLPILFFVVLCTPKTHAQITLPNPEGALQNIISQYNFYAPLDTFTKDTIKAALRQITQKSDAAALGYYMLANDEILKSHGGEADSCLQKGINAASTDEALASLYQLDEQLATNLLFDFTRTKASVRKAIELFETVKDYGTASFSQVNLAYAYLRSGQCDSAEIQNKRALEYFYKNENAMREKGNFEAAKAMFLPFHKYMAGQIYVCLGEQYLYNGEEETAHSLLDSAIITLEQLLPTIIDPFQQGALNFSLTRGFINHRATEKKALDYINVAIQKFKALGLENELASSKVNKAYLSAVNKNLADTTLMLEALSILLQQKITSLQQPILPEWFQNFKSKNLYYLRGSFYVKAQLSDALYQQTRDGKWLDQKIADLRTVLEIAAAQRLLATEDESLYVINRQFAPMYRQSAASAFALYEKSTGQKKEQYLNECWDFVQRGKEAVLRQNINQNQMAEQPGETGELAKKNKQYTANIRKKYNDYLLSSSETAEKNREQWVREKAIYQKWLQDTLAQGTDNMRNYFQQRHSDVADSISIQNVQKYLDADQTILEYYYLNSTELLVFIVQKNDVLLKRLTVRKDLGQLCDSLMSELGSDNNNDDRPLDGFAKIAYETYQQVVQPIRTDIKNKRVIVCGDRKLARIPFDVLLSKNPENIVDFKSFTYLIEDYAFSYNYSSSAFKLMSRLHSKYNKFEYDWVGFAPFVDSLYLSTNNLEIIALRSEYKVLRQTAIEINKIYSYLQKMRGAYNTVTLFGKNADLNTFLRYAGKSRILHLSTHGKFSNSQAYILFYLSDDSLNNKVFLSLQQIYTMEIPSEFVYLNACETSTARWLEGNGAFSISRAFAFAGTQSIIAHLWNADEWVSSGISEVFYEELVKPKGLDYTPKDIALQQAKLSRKKFSPRYWGSSIIIGNLKPID